MSDADVEHVQGLSGHDYTVIAAKADVSPATVRRYWLGSHDTHRTTRRRIERAMRALGFAPREWNVA